MRTVKESAAAGALTPAGGAEAFWFPGRWLGGTSLIFGPLLLLTGVLLRLPYDFFFPHQLAAYQDRPGLITAAYNLFAAGNIFMWPAVATLAARIGAVRPRWGQWGGALVIFGLFARTFRGGIDHVAFQMVRIQGLETATRTVGDSYGAFQIASGATVMTLTGWATLAIGAYLSGTLALWRSIALALMSGLMGGVLKGSTPMSVVWTAGLCVALVPLGVEVLNAPPRPGARRIAAWIAFLAVFAGACFFIGQLG